MIQVTRAKHGTKICPFSQRKKSTDTDIKFKFSASSSQDLLIQRGIATEDLYSIYLLPCQSTTETILIAFQNQILHKILSTNATLCKMKIKDSDLCPLCRLEKHAITLSWGGRVEVPAAHNSKTIRGIEMKFARVVENHKLNNLMKFS